MLLDRILWDEWIKLDPIANTMFKLRSRKEREIHVNRILSHVLGALDDPTAGREKLKNLGRSFPSLLSPAPLSASCLDLLPVVTPCLSSCKPGFSPASPPPGRDFF